MDLSDHYTLRDEIVADDDADDGEDQWVHVVEHLGVPPPDDLAIAEAVARALMERQRAEVRLLRRSVHLQVRDLIEDILSARFQGAFFTIWRVFSQTGALRLVRFQ